MKKRKTMMMINQLPLKRRRLQMEQQKRLKHQLKNLLKKRKLQIVKNQKKKLINGGRTKRMMILSNGIP